MVDSGWKQITQATAYIREQTSFQPAIGLILGSGLSSLAQEVDQPDILPYERIPHFPQSTVQGHSGRMLFGKLSGQSVMVMQGRVHYYEGYSPALITFPIRIMQALGIHTLIVTNAAGGINPEYQAGDLMLIQDHINLVGMAGHNPLRGANDERLGVRFPDMSQAYDPALRRIAKEAATTNETILREGVYAMVAGPSFETPAEVRFLRAIGADAVGMSTAPEVVVARHGGMRVMGISLISNVAVATQDPESQSSHEEVLQAGQDAAPRLAKLLSTILSRLHEQR